MKYLAEDNIELIRQFGERISGQSLSREIARLYSHHTRLMAGTKGLRSWTDDERSERLGEAEKLLIAGLALEDSSERRGYLRRSAEIFEWSATSLNIEDPVPAVLLAASTYQLAEYPARASGVLSEHSLSEETSRVLKAFLRADFKAVQNVLRDVWQQSTENIEGKAETHEPILDQLLRAMGIIAAWMRWGEDDRIHTALGIIEKTGKATRYDFDRFSWLLAITTAEIAKKYYEESLWTVLSPITLGISSEGNQAIKRYIRLAFLENKMLTWPSQREGINGILEKGSFALCTPTGSGKTRVAEIVILKHLFAETDTPDESPRRLILYLAPSRALSTEVESNLSKVLYSIHATSVSVTSLYGGNDFGPSDLTNLDSQPTVVISTHEKADALIRLFGAALFEKISCVIVDEAHMAEFTGKSQELTTAQNRSLRLEMLVSRLKAICHPQTTFVALSAVASEIKNVLSAWISGVDDRPAIAPDYRSTRQLFGQLQCFGNGSTLIYYDVLDGQRLKVKNKNDAPYIPDPFPAHPPVASAFDENEGVEKKMRAHLLWAAMHFAQPKDHKKHSVLISVTEHPEWYAETFLTLLSDDWINIECPSFFTPPIDQREMEILSRCLASCADYFGKESREYMLLEKGIILHHGKMPPVMSRLFIDLIQSHVINIVIATSTLSEGVNLPFETVLIPSIRRGGNGVSFREIANLAGRAGRPGVSTEGKTLVLLAPRSREPGQLLAAQVYGRIVASMSATEIQHAESATSPLYALIEEIKRLWMELSRSDDENKFIEWLEKAAYAKDEGDELQLLTALDTLDQQLLSGIEEYENHGEIEYDLEKYLQALWQNTLARHEASDDVAERAFIYRGISLVDSIYNDKAQRRAIYHTGLPPREGIDLIEALSEIKTILKEADEYPSWDRLGKIDYLLRLVERIIQINAFEIKVKIGKCGWKEVFTWWIAPDLAGKQPTPKTVSRWYDYASKQFIYKLNWAFGAILGSILERDGGEGDFLSRWKKCELPWAVLWFKDMISWGTLDPVVSYIMAKKEAFTRPEAKKIADEYWNSRGVIDDNSLHPSHVSDWLNTRKLSLEYDIDESAPLIGKLPIKFIEDFSSYSGNSLRVLPVKNREKIYWYDPAGYMLAESEIPENWSEKNDDIDYVLKPELKIVGFRKYL